MADDGVGSEARTRHGKPPALVSRILLLVLFLALWQVLVEIGVIDSSFASSPIRIADALPDLLSDGELWHAFGYTGTEMLYAFIVGTAAGIAVGTLLGVSPTFKRALLGPILFLLSTPKVVFLPIFLIFFGVGQTSAWTFAAFEGFFYVTVNVLGGVEMVQAKHLMVGTAYGAGPLQRLTDIVLPSAVPGIFAGLWQGLRHAVSAVLIVELFASVDGIGRTIARYSNLLQPENAVAVMLIVSVIAVIAASSWARLEARLSRWASMAE